MASPTLRMLLGARQAEVMQYLWTYGAATVREYHTAIAVEGLPQYEAVLASFSRLREKGLVERRRIMPDEAAPRAKQAYVYVAAVTERQRCCAGRVQRHRKRHRLSTLFSREASARQLSGCWPISARFTMRRASRLTSRPWIRLWRYSNVPRRPSAHC